MWFAATTLLVVSFGGSEFVEDLFGIVVIDLMYGLIVIVIVSFGASEFVENICMCEHLH